MLTKKEFIELIQSPKDTILDYPFGNEVQRWSAHSFRYNPKTDTISHNRLPIITEVFARFAIVSPDQSTKITHG